MAGLNIPSGRGASKHFLPDKGGNKAVTYPVIGVVKNNVDPLRIGRIQVYIEEFGFSDSNARNNWITVRYMSPFYGITDAPAPNGGVGDYTNDPHTYGFWFTPPDLETHVLCVFAKGDINQGYYLGCVPKPGFNQMIPAIGSVPVPEFKTNPAESASYAGAKKLPVTEINDNSKPTAGSEQFYDKRKPVHSYYAACLWNQGIIRDTDRGTIGSSSQRESPSRTYGVITPGRPVYKGGTKDGQGAGSDPSMNVDARRGGHSLVLDDGDKDGNDQHIRFRTTTGHQIIMSDTADTIFIIHSNGKTWVEIGKEGTLDVYAANSINMRTEGDLNLHADRDINIHAKKKLNVYAEEMNVTTDKDTNFRVGQNFSHYVVQNYTLKTGGPMTLKSDGDAMFKSNSTNYIVGGPNVMINSGESSLDPELVKAIPIKLHTETRFDPILGFLPYPLKLPSITSRCPAHAPWVEANFGVDVTIDFKR